MNGVGTARLLFFGVLALDGVITLLFLAHRLTGRRRRRWEERARRLVFRLIGGSAPQSRTSAGDRRLLRPASRHRWVFLRECAAVSDAVRLSPEQRGALLTVLEAARMDMALIRELHARSPRRRRRAATYLPLVPTRAARVSLIRAMEQETFRSVRIFLAAALTELGERLAIPTMIDSLAGQPLRYQRSLWGLLSEFREELPALLPILMIRPEKEIQLLLIHFAGRCRSAELESYLVSRVGSEDLDISHAAFRALCAGYASRIDHARFLAHEDFLIRNLAAESLGAYPTVHSLTLLFQRLDDRLMRKSVALAITAILRARPQHFRAVMLRCLNESRETAHAALVDVLANFTDYLMEKLLSPDPSTVAQILAEMVRHGRTREIINFLNRNANPAIEGRAIRILKSVLEEDRGYAAQLLHHLNPRILGRLGLKPPVPEAGPPERREHPSLPLLLAFLGIGVLLLPALCLTVVLLSAGAGSSPGVRFLTLFNASFAVYATILNGSYLLLLIASVVGIRRQAELADLLRLSLLFKENLLPSVSIISPAYNEEASIVESVSSLLTLRYPDYEVIVVNDGSRDNTLRRLIEYFGLERTDLFVHRYLSTEEIRGIYASKRYPELLVIDKLNGGKADSLNAGINLARKEYFAGIDADSLLERDALLNLTGKFLGSELEVVAAGGNILPVNGCTVRKGDLVRTGAPRRGIARFQTMEYTRAFMAGRVGWATLKTLLIISGAFGLFHRRRVIDARGYLTRSERYMKDTVGEDMELVVRLSRGLRDGGIPYAIQYAYDANCWTEIPERLKILARQRDRWQRGLLDIVSFHARMIGNPRYGRTGIIGFPYFLLFEVLGPWFEAEGLMVLIASIALGAIGLPLFLLVFTATVLLGLLVSVSSLIIAEHRRQFFPLRDKVVLALYAVLENFGFRPLMNFLRLRGHLRGIARVGAWGQMERRGLGLAAGQG
jgi:cellulose synthase/poly-beta-1,6-N-acetylglucosamine synthase-like glycosyltransferase/HEAT repeat protein